MDHSKLIVQSDQVFTSVKENDREREKHSESKEERVKNAKGRQTVIT